MMNGFCSFSVCRVVAVALVLVLSAMAPSNGEDWPVWRHDVGHTGVSPVKLPKKLSIQWVRELPPLERAWPDQERLEYDIAYEPIVAGGLLYLGSPHNDSVMAFDAATGDEKWRFYTQGPVRLAPTVADGLLYAGSDDGHLYCLDAATGTLRWRFRAALSSRRVLGNTRMISVWPVRGAPVVAEGVVHFAAGIWPFEGVSVYALDARTGDVVWINDNCDARFMLQPHHSPAFAGIAPQGYLAVAGDRLLVPNGRTTPASFDRRTGELQYFEMDANNRHGDYRVAVRGDHFFNPNALFELETGRNLGVFPPIVTFANDLVIGVDRGQLRAFDLSKIEVTSKRDSKGREECKWEAPLAWALAAGAGDVIVADTRLYGCKSGGIFAMDLPRGAKEPKIAWEMPVEGSPVRLIAANGMLYVTTIEGRLYCFGEKSTTPQQHPLTDGKAVSLDNADLSTARSIVEASGVKDGYALTIGADAVDLAAALARESNLHVVVAGGVAETAAARVRLDGLGLHGSRVALFDGDLAELNLPPYFASLAVVTSPGMDWRTDRDRLALLYEHLRPYGGVACFVGAPDLADALEKTAAEAALPGAQVERNGDLVLLKRTGPLPDSADWTHQYGDASNTVVSREARVRAPLGLLWFGGSSHADILPRHGHGPSEQVVGGRLFIEGPDMIRGMDVYTGRVLWQTTLEGIGKAYDNTSHQPGANAIGSNYVSVEDGIYVAYGDKCLRLDPATGLEMSTFTLPVPEGAAEPPDFGYIGVWGDILVAGSGPLRYDEEIKGKTWNAVASKRIVAMNRHTGEPLWSKSAHASFRHNAIALGSDRVFCVDRATDELRELMERRGITLPEDGRLLALDIRTGEEVWRSEDGIFGTWLGYSSDHDILLEAGRASRDMLDDEPNDRMRTYKASDGKVLWKRETEYNGPCMLHGDTIIAQERFFSLLTGESLMRVNPLTGEQLDMNWVRQYGCNSAVACQNLVTFRSAAAGFFDLENDGGTGNLGGFKSGCTSNLIAANGVLNAPDYTRTCTCSYQNQSSLAFVHTPSVEMWTYNAFDAGAGRVKRLGLNLGAPGDRRDEHGTLWLDYPSVGGQSPSVAVETEPAAPKYYRYHSLRVDGDGPAWVAASGATGLRRMSITVEEGATVAVPYTVRLYFAEPDTKASGGRIFDVALQGKPVVTELDVAAEAGGAMLTLMKEFPGIAVTDKLEITLSPKDNAETILSGVEMIME